MAERLVVALIAPAGEEQAACARELGRRLPVDLDQFASLRELRRGCAGKRYHGMAVTSEAVSSMQEEDKLFLIGLAQSFPLLRVLATARGRGLEGTVAGDAFHGPELVERFGRMCQKAGLRGVRLEARKMCALCASLHFAGGAPPEKAFILNVSHSGFFVATAHDKAGPRMEVVVEALSDRRPIRCEVRWHQPWGADARSIPGFGVFIQSIEGGQRAALESLADSSAQE
jgi:hypothetical protein